MSKELNDAMNRMRNKSHDFFRDTHTNAILREQHADTMHIETRKLENSNELLHLIKLNNEQTHQEFQAQERKNKKRFWISALIAGISAVGAIISAIIAIISVCQQ